MKLLRLEQRRVLNADFTFAAQALHLDNIDGDVTVREVTDGPSPQIEFDLHGGSVWQDADSTGVFAIDNSTPGHSILKIAKSDLESLSSGLSLHAAASGFDLQFDVQSSALDLSQMHGSLVAEGFGQISQTAANEPHNEVRLGDVSLSASHISLSQFHGDDISLTANEIDLTGGADSFSGSTLSIHAAKTTDIELGGNADSANELNFTDSDITALDASFHHISFAINALETASSLHVESSGADFQDAILPGHESSLHLTADSVQIDGALSISGGLIDVRATQDATISATGSLVSHGGEVHVAAAESGTLLVSGRIDVSNSEPGGVGGNVHLLGEQVGLFGGAEVDASGHSGGGEVLIGGDLHGDNEEMIPHAARVFVGHEVEIHADALQAGDGGQVVVWSDEVTQVYGSLTARGGVLLGDGGLIETSSHQQLIVTRGGDASAPHGQAGTWLLDPLNVRIVAVTDPPTIFGVTELATPPDFKPTVSDSQVTDEAIEDQLKLGTTVEISTFNPEGTEAGDITQDVSIDVIFENAGDSATLIYRAANDIFVNAEITGTNGTLSVQLEANAGDDDLDQNLGNVNINANIAIDGMFTSTGVGFDSAGVTAGNTFATITATGGVKITHTDMVELGQISTDVVQQGGITTGLGFGGSTSISEANVRGSIEVFEGSVLIEGGNEDLIVMADITATESIVLVSNRDVIVEATVTAGGLPADQLDSLADLTITSDADSDGVGGFWLRESNDQSDARLNAGGNIVVVGARLNDAGGNQSGEVSLRIDADETIQPQIVAGLDVTITANFGNVANAGDVVLEGMIQATDGALTVFFTDMAFVSADQSAGTDLLFQNAVQLTGNVTLTAGNDATLASTIDDDGDAATGSALTVIAEGNAIFDGAIGGLSGQELDALTVTGDGLIDFSSSISVAGDIFVTGISETDRITIQGAVTTTNDGSVTITNAGLLVTSSMAQFNVATNFVQNGTGSTELGAGITTVNGDVSFAQAVLLTRRPPTPPPLDPTFDLNTTIDTSAGNGNITFSGTIDSEVTGANEEQALALQNPTGGNFQISWQPPIPPGSVGVIETTAAIAFNATAADVRAALVALPSLTEEDILVTGDPGGPFTLTFRGAFRGTNVEPVVIVDAGLTRDPAPVLTQTDVDLDDMATTLSVVDASLLPNVDNDADSTDFFIQLDSELLAVTDIDVANNELTVRRGQNGTTPAAHVLGQDIAPFDAAEVLTTVPGTRIVPEHNPLTLTAGLGMILFEGDIGAEFNDVGLGVDGDQTLGDLTISSAGMVTFNSVQTVATNGSIDIGAGISVIPSGIAIDTLSVAPTATTFQSQQNIRFNGQVTVNGQVGSQVDLSLLAAGDVTLTSENGVLPTAMNSIGGIITNGRNVVITADSNGDMIGDLRMGELSVPVDETTVNEFISIDAGAGFIDVSAAEVFLGRLISSNTNPTDAENPAIRVFATFRSINDINGDDNVAGLNLVANTRDPLDSESPGAGVVLEAVLGIGVHLDRATGNRTDNALETDIASLSAFNHDLSERQVITLANATGGNFTISWTAPGTAGPETTLPIPFNATADLVKAEFLRTFSTLTPADLDVSGNTGGPFTLDFLGALRSTNVIEVETDSATGTAGLIGSDPTATPETVVSVMPKTISDFKPAENNIVIRDVGTVAGRVDLIFVHNEANQDPLEPQFASAVSEFTAAVGFIDRGTVAGTNTTLTFSAATPGRSGNDIEISFTKSPHDESKSGVPIITVAPDGRSLNIDLDDAGTTANALRDEINSHHAANQIIRALITSDPLIAEAPGIDDITGGGLASITLSGAGAEDGVIDINIENGDLRVVADNSRLVLSEMQEGIDTFDPPDLAVAAVQSENTIRLTAGTIEVFDDILAIQPLTQITTTLDATATTITVVDPSVFDFDDQSGLPDAAGNFIQINSEVLRVTSIVGNELTVERGQKGTAAVDHVAGTVIANIDVDNGIRGYINIQAAGNFVLGADRVISTDDHYINSLNLAEDINGNGRLDVAESFDDDNGNGRFDRAEQFTDTNRNLTREADEPFVDLDGDDIFDPAEVFDDLNGNGTFDASDSFEDLNGNGRLDSNESFFGEDSNENGTLQVNYGEDANRNGVLDPSEDTNANGILDVGEDKDGNGTLDLNEDINGDGILQLRGNKPSTAAVDDFFSQIAHDVIQITASGTQGRVLLGENSTISTDNGIEQLISPRPLFSRVDNGVFVFQPGTAFFSGNIEVAPLESRFLDSPETLPDGTTLPAGSGVFLARVTFTIGAPGEKNLVLDIDWGDHDRTQISQLPPTTDNLEPPQFIDGVFVFSSTQDQHATRFLIPEGGAKYSIPHDYSQSAFNLETVDGVLIQQPGRGIGVTTDPIQVRFAVSQHSSIVIDGQAILDPRIDPQNVATAMAAVPQNAAIDNLSTGLGVNFPKDNPPFVERGADPLFQLTSTDVLDDPDLFLPRFDNGIIEISIPTPPSPPRLPDPIPIPPPALPKPFIPDPPINTPPQVTTESSGSAASAAAVATDEYFELRRINEDGTTTAERIQEGEKLLLDRTQFEGYVGDLGDGEYQIWFITRENRDGTLIERPVIEFRLESGRLAPPTNDSPTLFKPFKLIPVPPDAKKDPPKAGEAAAPNPDPNAPAAADQKQSDDEMSAIPFDESHSHQWLSQETGDSDRIWEGAVESSIESHSSDSSSIAVGVLLAAGARWRKNRFNPSHSSLFSKTARLARKRSAPIDDQ